MKSDTLNLYRFVDLTIHIYYQKYENKDDIRQAGYEAILTSSSMNQEKEILAAMRRESRFFKEDRMFNEDSIEAQSDVEVSYLKKEFWELVESILTYKEYEVIHAVFAENKTYSDIAEKLGVSTQRVAAIKQTAITKLREQRRFFE